MDGETPPSVESQLARERLRQAAARLDLHAWVRGHALEAVVGSLAAGFLVGSSPKTMAMLAEALLQIARKFPPSRT